MVIFLAIRHLLAGAVDLAAEGAGDDVRAEPSVEWPRYSNSIGLDRSKISYGRLHPLSESTS
jgi:hypothetical protein